MRQRHYIPAADILRVACIGLIAWYHFWQLSWLDPGFRLGSVYVNMQQMVRNSYMLVDTLLLLSGFLLCLPYARHLEGLGPYPSAIEFYKRRALRILPSYLAAIFLAFFLWAIPTGQYNSPHFALKDLFAHLSFTHNLSREVLYRSQLPGVLWTLAVEVQFYLLFPLIARFFCQKPLVTCSVLGLLGLGFRALAMADGDLSFLGNQLPVLLDVYAVGMFCAYFYARLERHPWKRRWPFALLALLCFLCILQLLYLQPIGDRAKEVQMLRRLPLALLGGGFLLFGSLAPTGVQSALGNPLTRFFSGISYNFYIWHQFLGRRLVDWRFPPYQAAENPNMAYEQPWQSQYMAVAFLVAFLAAVLGTYLVEKPAVRRLTRKEKEPSTR